MNHEKKTYISSIYNYCDRWCDKCKFTSNCLLYSNESKIAAFEILNDRLPNAEEMMNEIFDNDEDPDEEIEQEIDMLYDEEEDDEDFLFASEDDVNFEEPEIIDDNLVEKESIIEKSAKEYFDLCTVLLEKIDTNFNFYSASPENITVPEAKKIYSNFEIISWYHTLIYVKIKRAIGGKKKYLRERDEEFREISKSDMEGTAKVAAISVTNSLNAMNQLHSYLPEYGVEIVKLTSILKEIFKEIEKEFPGYKNFIRPGFDE